MNRRKVLVARLWRNALWAFGIIVVALVFGMMGYTYFGALDFTKSFANAAMILSGMGPLDQMPTKSGEVFEGIYALLSGLLFLAVAGFALAPALHHILRGFHLEDQEAEQKAEPKPKK
jgi:TRAP-type C4-dicarboxylate transport system permease small subunit